MPNFMAASGLSENLPAEAGVMYIPGHGETLRDRFTIIWQGTTGVLWGSDYQWADSDCLTVWGNDGWYSIGETEDPDPFEPGDDKIIAVFWENK